MPDITPDEFIAKWSASTLKERSAAQSHFNDLCRLLDEPTPTDADPDGSWYCFERGATERFSANALKASALQINGKCRI